MFTGTGQTFEARTEGESSDAAVKTGEEDPCRMPHSKAAIDDHSSGRIEVKKPEDAAKTGEEDPLSDATLQSSH